MSNDLTILIRINARSAATRAGVEAAFFPQVLKHPNLERNEENNKCLHNLVTCIMYTPCSHIVIKRISH